MGEFCNGWQRKIGVLTLVVACLFAAGWLRSLGEGELISFGDFIDVQWEAISQQDWR